jgi:hypothetical protein
MDQSFSLLFDIVNPRAKRYEILIEKILEPEKEVHCPVCIDGERHV